ncbi:gpW family head-tail joining protein [Wolbachia endosymbiont of Oedothorax gibbosus]|uniref:gpW family head-tail joining protein n=1 Tax=Wolbachia endosymbiont of Oedothorax gibbosus TaxID=931100 RepID=UPI002023C791|nr:gpW family head-tail joining protein [Wolbachia endosymbiont of Oedothorax gibbosus]
MKLQNYTNEKLKKNIVDLTQVEEAIKKLQSGERVVSIAYGDHVVRYGEVQIKDLLDLRQRIKSELKVAVKRKIVISTNKGVV